MRFVRPAASSVVLVILALAPARAEEPRPDATLTARLVAELSSLSVAANAEEKASPRRPAPSQELAYFLLAGLAAESRQVASPLESRHRAALGIRVHPGGGMRERLVRVSADVWIYFAENTMQDKSGSYVTRFAELFLRRAGNWHRKGGGALAGAK